MITNRRITRRRHLLAGAAAIAVATTAPVVAQVLPSGGTVTIPAPVVPLNPVEWRYGGGAFNVGGVITAPVIPPGDPVPTNLDIRIGSTATLIDWQSFSIGAGNTVEFQNNVGGAAFAVLNRVGAGAAQSTIDGILRGDGMQAAASRGSIWLVNPNGILFGPNSSVTNMASFVASSLAVTDDEFSKFAVGPYATPEDGVRFNGGTAGISLGSDGVSGANINVSGVVLLVAPEINLAGGAAPSQITGREVGFVVAQDVSVRLSDTSLMRIGITSGTAIEGVGLLAAGTVNGQRIYAATARQASVVDALLNVTGTLNATEASLVGNAIVLHSGRTNVSYGAGADVTISVDGPSNANAMNINIADSAVLTQLDSRNAFIFGNGDVTMPGTLTTIGNIDINASGNVTLGTISGAGLVVDAVGSVGFTGLTATQSVVNLAGASVSVGSGGISALTRVVVDATGGDITTAGGTIRSNSGNADTDATLRTITLTATGAIGTPAAGVSLATGPAGDATKLNAVEITAGNGRAVTLGNIDASALTISPAIVGDINLGLVDLTSGLTLKSAGTITIANLSARGAIDLESAAALTVTGISNLAGSVTLRGSSVGIGASGISTETSIAVTAETGNITTSGGTLRSNSIDAVVGARGITLSAASGSVGTGGANAAQLVTGLAGTPASLDTIAIIAGPIAGPDFAVAVGAITASGLTVNPEAGNIVLGATNLSGGLSLIHAGSLNIASLTTGNTIDLNAAGALQTGSLDNAAGTVTLRGSSIQVTDTSGLTVASATSTGGSTNISATGALAISGNVAATGGGVTLAGAGVTLGNNAAPSTIMSADGVSIDAGAGAITLGTQNVAITANSGNTAPGLRTVNLTGAAGVGGGGGVLSVVAGTNQSSGLPIVIQRDAGASVTLGAVTGGSLMVAGEADQGSIALGDVQAFGGNISLVAGTLTTGSLGARDNIALTSAGAMVLSVVRAGGGITIAGAPASVTATGIEATGAINITTPGLLTITGGDLFATRQEGLNAELTGFDVGSAGTADLTVSAGSYAIGFARAAGNLSLTATASAIDAGAFTLQALQALSLTSATGVTLANSGTYTFGTDLNINVGMAGPITANGGLSITAPNGAIRFNGATTANDGLTLTARSLELGTVTGAGAAAAIGLTTTNAGDLTTGSVSSLGALTLSAAGIIIASGVTDFTAVDTVGITGPVSINNGLNVSGTAVTMGDVVTRATGSGVGIGGVTITATTGNATAGTIGSRGDVAVTANGVGGAVQLTGASAAGSVLVTANAGASVNGSVTTAAAGTYIVRAGEISLGTVGQSFTQSGDGGVLLQTATGAVSTLGAMTIAAGGGNLVIDGATGISGGATLNNPGRSVLLRSGAGTAITLGNVNAARLDTAQINFIPTELPSHYDGPTAGLLTSGAITLGEVTLTDPVNIRSTNGAVTVAGASSSGAVSIVADAGTLTVGLDAANTGSVSSGGAGAVTLTSSTGNAIVRAGISTDTGAVNIMAGSDVTLGRTGSTVAQGGNGFTVSAQRQISGLGTLTVTSDTVSLAAGTIAPAGGRSIAFDNSSTIAAGAGTVTVNRGVNFSGLALGTVTTGSLAGLGTAIAGAVDIASLTTSTGGIALASTGRMAIGTASSSNAAGISLDSGAADLVLGQVSATGALASVTLRGATISVATTPSVSGAPLARTGTISATGTVNVRSPGAVSVAGDVSTTGAMLTLDGGPSVQVSGNISSDNRVVVVGDTVSVSNVTSGNDIVLVARTGNLSGNIFTIQNSSQNNDAPVDGDGASIQNPISLLAIGALPGKQLVMAAGGEILSGFTAVGEDSSEISATIVNLGTMNQAGTLTVFAQRITGDAISANQGLSFTTTGSNDAGLTPDGIYVGSLASSAGAITLVSGLDIVVGSGTNASGAINMTATRDVRLGQMLADPQLTINGGAALTLSGGRRVLAATAIEATGIVSITGGSNAMAVDRPTPDVQLGAINSQAAVTLTARTGLAAGAITTTGSITASASNGNLALGNLRGTDLLVTTANPDGGSITIASVEGPGSTNGASNLTVNARTTATINGPVRASDTIQIDAIGNILVTGPIFGSSLTASTGSSVRLDGLANIAGAISLTGGTGIQTQALTSNTGDAIGITATGGTVDTGNLAGGAIDVLGGGAVNIASVEGAGATTGAQSLIVTSSGGSVNIVGATRVGNAVTIDAATTLTTNVATGLVQAGTIDLVARDGDLNTGSLAAGDTVARALAGDARINSVTGTGLVRVEARGNTTITNALNTTGGAGVTLRAGQVGEPGSMGAISGSGNLETDVVNAGGTPIVLQANNGDINTGALTGSAVTSTASGVAPLGNTSIASITINGTGPTLVQSSGNSFVTGATSSLGNVTLRAGQIGETGAMGTIVAAGNLVAGSINAGFGTITLRAANGSVVTAALTGGAIAASATGAAGQTPPIGNVTLASVNGATLNVDTSNTATLQADSTLSGAATITAGAIDTEAVTAGSIGFTGTSSVDTGVLTAPTISVRATSGSVNVASAAGSTSVLLEADDGNVVSGAVTGGAITANATGAAGQTPPIGNVTLASVDAASLNVAASNTATLQADSTLSGAATITAGAIETEAVTAGSIGFTGTSSVGTGVLTAPTISVRATSGSVNVASAAGSTSVLLEADDGNVVSGAITGGAITANATGAAGQTPPIGNVTLASVNAASLNVAASNTATLQADSTLSGAATITAGAIETEAVTAGSVGFTGTSSVGTGVLTAPTISVRATSGSVNVASAAGSTSVLLEADDGNVVSGAVTGGAITANATGAAGQTPPIGNVTLASVDAASLNVAASNTATLQADSTLTGTATITAGAIDTEALTAGSIILSGLSSVGTGNLTAGTIDARAAAGAVTVASISNSGTVLVQATGNNTIGAIDATGVVTLRAGQVGATDGMVDPIVGTGNLVQTGTFTAREIIALANNGSIVTGPLTAGTLSGGVLTGGAIALVATRPGMAAADSTQGDIRVASIAQASQLTATAGRNLEVTGATVMTGNATLTASGLIRTGDIDLGNGALVASAANALAIADTDSIKTGALTNTTAIDLRATAGTVDVASVSNAGTVLVQASGNTKIGAVGSTGAVTLRAGQVDGAAGAGNLTAGTIAAGTSAITLQATNGSIASGTLNGGAVLATASGAAPAGNITIAAVNAATLGMIASSTATLSNDSMLSGAATIDANAISTAAIVAGSIGFTGVSSVATGNLTAPSIDVRATGGTASVASVSGSGTLLVQASGNTTIGAVGSTGAVTLRAGQVDGTAGAGNLVAGAIDAGTAAITLRATNGNITSAALSGGALLADATGAAPAGNVTIASATGTSLGVTASNGATLSNASSVTGAATITAATIATAAVNAGSIGFTGLSSVATGNLTAGSIDVRATGGTVNVASVSGSGTVLVQASGNTAIGTVGATGAVTLRAGQVGDTAGAGNLEAGAVNAGTAAITLRATAGNINSGVLTGGALLATASGAAPAGNITIAAANGASLGLTASSTATLQGASTLSGAATIGAAAISTQAVTAGSLAFTAATGATTGALNATNGNVDVRATNGAVTTGAITGTGTVLVQAGNNVTIGAIGTTGGVTLRAGQVGATGAAGTISGTGNLVTAAITAAGTSPIDLRANGGSITTGSLAGGAITGEATGGAGNITISGISRASRLTLASGGTVSFTANVRVTGEASLTANRIDLGSAAELRTDGGILLRANTGTTAVNIANGTGSMFDNEDMPRVFAPSLRIDALNRTVTIGTADLFPGLTNVGPPIANVGVTTTGDIDVIGTLTFRTVSGAPRTLTLGGDAVADSSANAGLATQARSVAVRVQTAGSSISGGRIVGDGSVIRLNGQFVAVGQATTPAPAQLAPQGGLFGDRLLGTGQAATAESARGDFTENPGSPFYRAIPPYIPAGTAYTFVTADKLVVRVQQWGLLQNTDTAAQPGGGVLLNNVQLLAAPGGPTGGPIVGFFGKLGGQEGIAAALRVSVDQLGGISPNNVRINGCVALTTAGCIVTGLPLPLVQLNDPNQSLLIRSTPELVLPVELISGTTNEALWRDDEADDPALPATPATEGARP